MRHRVAHRKLGRVTEHRIAMLRNQATALLRHEHLTTTVPRAKELRPFVERLITIAKRGVAAGAANGKMLNARRLVMHDVQDREVVTKLFDTLAPRFEATCGRLHAPAAPRLPQGRRRRNRAGRTGRQRVQPARKAEAEATKTEGARRSRRASAAACARRPSACAARRPKKTGRRARSRRARAQDDHAAKTASSSRASRRKQSPADRDSGALDSALGLQIAICDLRLPRPPRPPVPPSRPR